MSAKAVRKTGQATTAAVNGANAAVSHRVPQGKVWIIAKVAASVDGGVNTVEIYRAPVANVLEKMWDDLTNVTAEQIVDFLARYPRAPQWEPGEFITGNVITNEAVAKTLTFKVWAIEY